MSSVVECRIVCNHVSVEKKNTMKTYYIYKRNRNGAAFQLGWAFTKKALNEKLERYSFWKQNGYDVFVIER